MAKNEDPIPTSATIGSPKFLSWSKRQRLVGYLPVLRGATRGNRGIFAAAVVTDNPLLGAATGGVTVATGTAATGTAATGTAAMGTAARELGTWSAALLGAAADSERLLDAVVSAVAVVSGAAASWG